MPRPDLTDTQKDRYRTALLRKGQQVAEGLANVMAGRPVGLLALPQHSGRGTREQKRDRLRAFLDDLGRRRKALDANDGSFGLCTRCQEPIPTAELDELAWATECLSCTRA